MVSIFDTLTNPKKKTDVSLEDALTSIRNGKVQGTVELIQAGDKTLKNTLPCICFSGTFSERKSSALIEHSGYICLDFDKLPDPSRFRDDLKKFDFIYAAFISPSGTGVKALVRVHPIKNQIEQRKTVEELIKVIDSPFLDVSGKDIARVCFMSFDPDLWVNENAQTFYCDLTPKTPDYRMPITKIISVSDDQTINNLLKWWQKKYDMDEGTRNNSLFVLACSLYNFGIDAPSVQHVVLANSHGLSERECMTICGSALKTVQDNGTYASQRFEPAQQSIIKIDFPTRGEKKEEETKEWAFDLKRLTAHDIGTIIQDVLGHSVRYNTINDCYEIDGMRIDDRRDKQLWVQVDTFLKQNGYKKDLSQKLYDGALAACFKEYHPIKEVFEANKWDGKLRYFDFITYFKDKYGQSEAYITNWMFGAIERLYNCYQNPILVLDGEQNIGKSYLVKWLGSPFNGYSREDGFLNPDDKDSRIELTRKFVYEWGEARNLSKKEIESLKSLIFSDKIEERPPFGRHTISKNMLSSIIMTKNGGGSFLRDDTGNRRFNTLFMMSIDQSYSKKFDPLQIWLEVFELWKESKDKSWQKIDQSTKKEIDEEAFERPSVYDILDQIIEETERPGDFVSVKAIHDKIEEIDRKWDRNKAMNQRYVTSYMRRTYKTENKLIRNNNKIIRGYEHFIIT